MNNKEYRILKYFCVKEGIYQYALQKLKTTKKKEYWKIIDIDENDCSFISKWYNWKAHFECEVLESKEYTYLHTPPNKMYINTEQAI